MSDKFTDYYVVVSEVTGDGLWDEDVLIIERDSRRIRKMA